MADEKPGQNAVQNEDRIREVFRLYEQHGTLDKAAEVLGCTRQRVQQLLAKGNAAGFFVYPRAKATMSREQIIAERARHSSLQAVATANGMSLVALRALIKELAITEAELEAADLARRKARAAAEYKDFAAKYDREITMTDVQAHSRALYARIINCWHSTDAFRQELGLPPVPRGNPNFRVDVASHVERVSANAAARRDLAVATIRTILERRGESNLSVIMNKTGYDQNLVYACLNTMMDSGLVRRLGRSKNTRYVLDKAVLHIPPATTNALPIRKSVAPYHERLAKKAR